MPRRPRNPTGFVRKHPGTHAVRWQGIVKYPDPDRPGVWKQRSATFGRRAEAQAWVDATLAEHWARPDYRPPSEETFADYMGRWLRDVAALRVRASTLESHRAMGKHAVAAFGSKPLADLRPGDMQALYAALIASGRATTTVRYVHAVVRRALQDAVEMGLLASNPADRAKRPRVVKKEIVPPTPEQARAFLVHVDGDRLRGLWHFLALTGCRRGEALGLRWDDIDLDARTASIRRTLAGTGSHRRMQEPKTTSSRRTLALSTALVDALRQHRKQQLLERIAAGPEWRDTGCVFTTRTGTWLDPDRVRQRFHRLAETAGLPRTTRIHDLRHALATAWLAHGIPAQVVAQRLGHASIAITLSLYGHILPNQQADAAEEMDALLAPPVTTPSPRERGNGIKA